MERVQVQLGHKSRKHLDRLQFFRNTENKIFDQNITKTKILLDVN
jgi:hypothetical protein